MAIKGVTLDLEKDLHAKVFAAAKLRGQLVPQAYTEALERWLKWVNGEDRESSPVGEVSGREAAVLCAVLELLRDQTVPADDPRTIKPTLLELGKRYAARRPA